MARHLLDGGAGHPLVPQGDASWPIDSPFGLYLPFSPFPARKNRPRRLRPLPLPLLEKRGRGKPFRSTAPLYRRVAAKPTETSQADLLITIPIGYETTADGSIRLSDTVQIAGRTYTADCGTGGGQSGGGDDVGNTRATATDLIVPQATSSATGEFWFSPNYVLTAGDVDYFRLRVTQPIDLAVGSSGGTDTYGQLLDSSGLVLGENDDRSSSPPDFFVIAFQVEPGTYYLKVRGANSNTTGTYSLTVGAWLSSAGKVVAETYEQQLP